MGCWRYVDVEQVRDEDGPKEGNSAKEEEDCKETGNTEGVG